MSDDGYIDGGYSPYSDLEDLLYDADPAPDLADDLASHALHSPNFQDEPGYELAEYHSDWDYYSDDYYDDDPAILKNNPQDGSPIRRKGDKSGESHKRGKKRKLIDLDDIPDIDLGERRTLKDCMKGTVWAKPIPDRSNLYVPTKDDKIALLKDWKDVFGTTSVQDKATSKRPPLPEDESWANDMSLADMGLRNERGNVVEQPAENNDAEMEDEDGQGVQLDAKTAAALLQQMEGMNDEEAAALIEELKNKVGIGAPGAEHEVESMKQQKPLIEARSSSPSSADQINEPLPALAKRRKPNTEVLPSPPQSNQSPVLEQADAAAPIPVKNEDQRPLEESARGRGRPGKDTARAGARPVSSSTTNSRDTKKRKASASPSAELSKGATRPTASSRAKRVASNVKGSGTETSGKESVVSTRSTRSRKKL